MKNILQELRKLKEHSQMKENVDTCSPTEPPQSDDKRKFSKQKRIKERIKTSRRKNNRYSRHIAKYR